MAAENTVPLTSGEDDAACTEVTAGGPSRLRGIILNAILIDIGWAACVFAAAWGYPYAGVGVVALLLAVHWGVLKPCLGELSLIAAVTGLGFVVDSVLVATGFFTFEGATRSLAPLWLVALWTNMATTVNWCLSWMKGRVWLQALFGAIVGPFAYYMGTRIGALEFGGETGQSILIMAVIWGVVFPVMYAMNELLMRRYGR